MKSKLKKMVIDNVEYLYLVSNKLSCDTKTNTLSLKTFLSGEKQTPLIIEFVTADDYHQGNVLMTGVNLVNKFTNVTDRINLNEPKYIRLLIEHAIKKGWTGFNKIETQNGLDYLIEFGYQTDSIKPQV
jgi:hypothetical protein